MSEELLMRIQEMAERIKQLEAEVQEQCRLNGMGAERELALMAKVERLERENAELQTLLKTSMEQHEIVGRLHQDAVEKLHRFTSELDKQMRGRDDQTN